MKRLALMLAVLTLPPAAGATEIWWNPSVEYLTAAIATVWGQPGDHVVNIPPGTYSGSFYSSGAYIDWQGLGLRRAASITLRGTGAGETRLMNGIGNPDVGMNRINDMFSLTGADFTGITFKDLALANGFGGGYLFGLWQNGYIRTVDGKEIGGYRAHVTFENVDLFLGQGSILGRILFHWVQDAGKPATRVNEDGQMIFLNSRIYTANTVPLVTWGYDAGHPIPFGGLLDGTQTSVWLAWSAGPITPFVDLYDRKNYTVDPTGGDLQKFLTGAGNVPAGQPNPTPNNHPIYGGFIAGFTPAPNPDADGDGIPDAWEYTHGGTNLFSAGGDYDRDGLHDGEEYIADTLPTSALSVFRIAAISNRVGRILVFDGVSGRTYRVRSSTLNLSSAGWRLLPGTSVTVTVSGATSITDTNQDSPRFYRLSVEKPR